MSGLFGTWPGRRSRPAMRERNPRCCGRRRVRRGTRACGIAGAGHVGRRAGRRGTPGGGPAWRHYRWPEKASPARVVWSSAPASDVVAEIVSWRGGSNPKGAESSSSCRTRLTSLGVRSELATVLPESDIAELSADVGPERRYREFLRVRTGQATVVIGTRTAVFAPVQDLGAIIMWADGNDVYRELHAPYWDAREVAAMRSHQTSCDVFVGLQRGASPPNGGVVRAARHRLIRSGRVGGTCDASMSTNGRAIRRPSRLAFQALHG